MTHVYVVLKKLDGKNHALIAGIGEQLIMTDDSALEFDTAKLVKAGFLKQQTDSEALKYHQKGK